MTEASPQQTVESREVSSRLDELYWEGGRKAVEPYATEYPLEVVYSYVEMRKDFPDRHGHDREDLEYFSGLIPSLTGDRERDVAGGIYTEGWNINRALLAGYWIEEGETERGIRLLAEAARYDNPFGPYDPASQTCEGFWITDALSDGATRELFTRALDSYDGQASGADAA